VTPDAAPESLRAFVAVEIDAEAAGRAAEIVERLRRADAGRVKWVDPVNFHLTLKFLGATRRDTLPQLGAALQAVTAEAAPFEMELAGVGTFPNLRRPQVIWLGVTKGSELLAALAGQMEAACAALGWAPEEKPYRAHLTLGRLREPRRGGRPTTPAPANGLAAALQAEGDAAAGVTPVRRLVLMESRLGPQGPTYTVIEPFPLRGAAE
jgi:2'-5' RNA ligase